MSKKQDDRNEPIKELFHNILEDEEELKIMDLIIDGKESEEILQFFIDKWR